MSSRISLIRYEKMLNEFVVYDYFVKILKQLEKNYDLEKFKIGHVLSLSQQESLNEALKNAKSQDSFGIYLLKLIDKYNLEDSSVYKKAIISKQQFSKIKNEKNNGKKYQPNKRDIFRIAFAMRLSLEETYTLLRKANYNFVETDFSDVIFMFCLKQKIWDYNTIEALLEENTEPPLFPNIE